MCSLTRGSGATADTPGAARLVIVCGLPGAGKTTVATAVERAYGAVRLAPDDWMDALEVDLFDQTMRGRIEQLQWSLAQRLLAQGVSVVIEWGTWRREERDELRTAARRLGAAVELRVLDAPVDVLWERVRVRDMERRLERRALQRSDIESYVAMFERPDPAELLLFDPPLDERHERHVHRTDVVLADGTALTAVSFHEADPYGRDRLPEFGLYLDERWSPPWPHEHVDWPDFGVPGDVGRLRASLQRLLERARRGDRVEIGCLGGHGRTGTALACLAVLTGSPPDAAVAWVRAAYCPDAVETDEQRAFAEQFSS